VIFEGVSFTEGDAIYVVAEQSGKHFVLQQHARGGWAVVREATTEDVARYTAGQLRKFKYRWRR
jgi:hypothetical protein